VTLLSEGRARNPGRVQFDEIFELGDLLLIKLNRSVYQVAN
jgi:hypothetical protein